MRVAIARAQLQHVLIRSSVRTQRRLAVGESRKGGSAPGSGCPGSRPLADRPSGAERRPRRSPRLASRNFAAPGEEHHQEAEEGRACADQGAEVHQEARRAERTEAKVIARSRAGAISWTDMPGPPELIAIDHDDHHAEHVGRTEDGQQFFLTSPFEPAIGDEKGSEYVALFLFDEEGNLVDAKIDDFGPWASVDEKARRRVYERRLTDLGDV